jgi:hypothetical protein
MFLAPPDLSGQARNAGSLFGRHPFRAGLTSLEAAQAAKGNRCWILALLLRCTSGILPLSGCNFNDKFRQLIGIAGARTLS